jgi:hypothetical protein
LQGNLKNECHLLPNISTAAEAPVPENPLPQNLLL